jgi:hypothetical protein
MHLHQLLTSFPLLRDSAGLGRHRQRVSISVDGLNSAASS